MLIIKENETKHFNFGVEIKGTKETPSARLVFEGNGNHKMFPVKNNNGEFSHTLNYSALKDLKEGAVYLEVMVGKTYFRPWQDTYVVKADQIRESAAPAKADKHAQLIKEQAAPIQKKPEPRPEFKSLRLEYKTLLKKAGASFLDGENEKNFQIKKKVLTMMENKYGKQVRPDLLKLNSIKIDELLIY